MSLLPFDALYEVARLFTWGATKYDAWNWAKGLSYTETMDSLLRHTTNWANRNDIDSESGFHHDVHILWNALVLVAMRLRGIGKDDRYDSNAIGNNIPRHPVEGNVSDPVVPVTGPNDPTIAVLGNDVTYVVRPDDDYSWVKIKIVDTPTIRRPFTSYVKFW